MTASSENSRTGFRLATLAAALPVPGDYNSNGVVDAADYVVWRKHAGTSFQLANEVASTTPGTVTPEDYTEWRARFGNTSGAAAGIGVESSLVPEPATAVLVVLWGALIGMRARRKRRG